MFTRHKSTSSATACTDSYVFTVTASDSNKLVFKNISKQQSSFQFGSLKSFRITVKIAIDNSSSFQLASASSLTSISLFITSLVGQILLKLNSGNFCANISSKSCACPSCYPLYSLKCKFLVLFVIIEARLFFIRSCHFFLLNETANFSRLRKGSS